MYDTTQLVIHRIHHYRDTIRSYHVEIDGERVGVVKNDNRTVFELPPGQHSVKLRLMWISSPVQLVDLPEGQEVHLLCGPNGGLLQAWRLFLAVSTAIFLRRCDENGEPIDEPADPAIDGAAEEEGTREGNGSDGHDDGSTTDGPP